MRNISKKEALEIAKRIIINAEKERLEIKDKEADADSVLFYRREYGDSIK
jgi:hypothetical protein